MKKLLSLLLLLALTLIASPHSTLAAGGIYASGGGTKTVGETFTVTVTASGATFNALEGTISVSGPVSIVSFSAGSATWVTAPANGAHFKGMVLPATSSLRVATVKLKATGVGSGAVSVSAVRLANAGADVGSGAGSAGFTIQRAADLPKGPTVTSSSHPDSNTAYEATTIVLSWNKDAGVDAFSYLLDQAEGTTPAAKTTDANTTITYADQAIGTYYFHIRAHKADGWGTTTHFKVNIKEPDAKIDPTLSAPSEIKIDRGENFINDLKTGTVTGLKIYGRTEAGFTANLTLTPAPTLPEGKTLSILSDETGYFELILDYPVVSGLHRLTVQGQKEKVLTPVSEEILFEITHAQGGGIRILTDDDEFPPIPEAKVASQSLKLNKTNAVYLLGLFLLVGVAIILIVFYRNRKKHQKFLNNYEKK